MKKNITTVDVFIDDTAKSVKAFEAIKNFTITKSELFKYAILMRDVPKKVKEPEYEYLQSKVPAMEEHFEDHIEFEKNRIINLSTSSEGKADISELVGVGIGLKYSSPLLSVNPKRILWK